MLAALAALSAAIWLWLLAFRGSFWRDGPYLSQVTEPAVWPEVVAVVPARNEEESIARTVRGLLAQDYPGAFSLIVVDDRSEDSTAAEARATADDRLRLISGTPLPAGWTGKMWAVHQGIAAVPTSTGYVWLTDADIAHEPTVLRDLVSVAEHRGLALTSQMVLLRCESAWEKLLIPAFVFFFKKLYPFRWINDPRRRTAGAAGGCMLVRRNVLAAAGGIAAIRNEVIDDCALARLLKPLAPIWLGLTHRSHSLRRYDTLGEIWAMVARTAFVQLRFSYLLVCGTTLAMALIYLVPPIAFLWRGDLLGLLGWGLMSLAFLPTLRLYRLSLWRAALLPIAALLYTAMTISSAYRYGSGSGPRWKDRTYSPQA
jgi:hopene-associated glycosyltransferase HpnB